MPLSPTQKLPFGTDINGKFRFAGKWVEDDVLFKLQEKAHQNVKELQEKTEMAKERADVIDAFISDAMSARKAAAARRKVALAEAVEAALEPATGGDSGMHLPRG